MKLWIDDTRPAPKGYAWCKSVNEAKDTILLFELYATVDEDYKVEVIDLDYDSGDYEKDGGPYIKLMDWLEETKRDYPIRIHSMNPVGVENMRCIIRHNGWKEIK